MAESGGETVVCNLTRFKKVRLSSEGPQLDGQLIAPRFSLNKGRQKKVQWHTDAISVIVQRRHIDVMRQSTDHRAYDHTVVTIYVAVAGQLTRWVHIAMRIVSGGAGALKLLEVNGTSANALPSVWQQYLNLTVELGTLLRRAHALELIAVGLQALIERGAMTAPGRQREFSAFRAVVGGCDIWRQHVPFAHHTSHCQVPGHS